jgi:hypothetical protein
MAEKEKPAGLKPQERLIYLLIGLFIAVSVLNYLFDLGRELAAGPLAGPLGTLVSFLVNVMVPLAKAMSLLITVVTLWGIYRIWLGSNTLALREKEIYGFRPSTLPPGETLRLTNTKWERVVELINSANSSDWRVAIIEADVMLEELMQKCGYRGETVGEMLKSVEKSDFPTIDSAWEAHKIRNRIAHSGSAFQLNEREAKQAIALYETVFKEFKII